MRQGQIVFRVSFFLPAVLSLVIVGIIWGWVYNPLFGLLNSTLRALGLESWTRGWLGEPGWALAAIILAGAWTYFGFCMVVFLAALQGVDRSLYEAAVIDGASRPQVFWHITLPSIRGVITLMMVNSLVGSFKVFDIVYVMTAGGPFHNTDVIGTYMYTRAFRQSLVGYSASMAVVLTVVVVAGSLFLLWFRERTEVSV
ncbi:MAG: sugar ABC transporter permease [Deinococcus sp.]|nr:sugar ABC transporter permease [Deinococcus sp.]